MKRVFILCLMISVIVRNVNSGIIHRKSREIQETNATNIQAVIGHEVNNEIISEKTFDEILAEGLKEEHIVENKNASELTNMKENDEFEPNKKQIPLGTLSSPTNRPTLFQQAQQIITNPFGQFIDTIRRTTTTTTKSPETEFIVETTSNPNILQQFQAGVQSIGNQITNVFTGEQNNAELPPITSTVRPNIIQSFSTNLQNAVQSVQNAFRPNEPAGGVVPQGPLQNVLTNVQNFFTGNREPTVQTTQQQTDNQNPEPYESIVDDKIDYKPTRNSEETTTDVEFENEKSKEDILVEESSI